MCTVVAKMSGKTLTVSFLRSLCVFVYVLLGDNASGMIDVNRFEHFACVSIKNCPYLLKLIAPDIPQSTKKFLRDSRCEYTDFPRVWCEVNSIVKDCITTNHRKGSCIPFEQCTYANGRPSADYDVCDYTETFGSHTCCAFNEEIRRQNMQLPKPENGECGFHPTGVKIFGGQEAELDEFPWMAILQYSSPKGMQQLCSGSLINQRYVITAAHCIESNLHSVVLGEYDTRNRTDCFGLYCAPPPVVMRIATVILHPQWRTGRIGNDIALLKLDREVQYTEFIRPICLPKEEMGIANSEGLLIAGWGKTDNPIFRKIHEKRSPVKMKAEVRRTYCPANPFLENVENVVCAGGNGRDICSGDSGGPLMFGRVISGDYLLFLGGIVSFGLSRCGDLPSVYTYVPSYMDWILETVQNN